jgi:hypothetical protein
MAVERKKEEEKKKKRKFNDYSGTIVSERRRWRTHMLGPKEKKSMIIVVPSCLKDVDGARTRSDQNTASRHPWQ